MSAWTYETWRVYQKACSERDEAREEAQRLRADLAEETTAHFQARNEATELRRERAHLMAVARAARWQVFDHPDDTEQGLIDAVAALPPALRDEVTREVERGG